MTGQKRVSNIKSQDDIKMWIQANCPLFWSLLNNKAQRKLPNGLVVYLSNGAVTEIEDGKKHLKKIEKYLHGLEKLCGLKAVYDAYKRDLSGIDSENQLAELFCEIAICAYIGNISNNLKLKPPTAKGTYSDCAFDLCGFQIFGEVKRYLDPWPGIEELGSDNNSQIPFKRSISESKKGEKPNDTARPRSMDLRSKLQNVHKQFPDDSINILFVFHKSLAYSDKYLRQAMFGDSNYFKNDNELVLEQDGFFSKDEWRIISACYLARICQGSDVIFPLKLKNPRALFELPKSVMCSL